MSSWFGGGSKKSTEENTSSTSGGFLDDSSSIGNSAMSSFGGGGSMGGGNNSANLAEFQQFSMALQEQMLVQHVISDITDKAFTLCMPSSSRSGGDGKLTGKEVACIHSAANKWLDCNELLMTRLAKKQQQASSDQYA